MSLSPIYIEDTESVGSSPPRADVFSSPSSEGNRSEPGSSPPPPWHCNDFLHCFAPGAPIGNPGCVRPTSVVCPGLGLHHLPTPPSLVGGIIHPFHGTVESCGPCRVHETRFLPNKLAIVDSAADFNQNSGFRNQLCRRCIRDEVELYWMRQGTIAPLINPAGAQSSATRVRQWPQANGIQDLCICAGKNINPLANTHCHACRDEVFGLECWDKYTVAEEILRNRKKAVITGRALCDALVATAPLNWAALSTINKRADKGIGRACPCGADPKQQSNPEYITICLSCEGVRIDPAHLPPELQQRPIMAAINRRASLRRVPQLARTKGPQNAERNHMYRVNIEFGWILGGDTNVGGA